MSDFQDYHQEKESKLEKKSKVRVYKKQRFQKQIVEDRYIGEFFDEITTIEDFIFTHLENCIKEKEINSLSLEPVAMMLKLCTSLLDMKKKQLEIKLITNFTDEEKFAMNEFDDD
ncbi:MAG: hypothetical protein EBS61_09460 [Betaproteobacteria bacterium]|jgi:hypothetical protein|nr:hypothetical protein [Betaproteobacteria bacterium]